MLTLLILLVLLGGLGRRRWYGPWGRWGFPGMGRRHCGWGMGPRPPMGPFGPRGFYRGPWWF